MSLKKILLGVTTLTLATRLLSLVSNQVFMSFFGGRDVYLNMYSYALNIPNIMFNFVGTVISAVVVPIYSGLLVTDRQASRVFIHQAITFICVVSLLLIGAGMFLAPVIAGWTNFHANYHDFLITALRVMMFAMFFYGLNYVFQGILQSHERFLLPAVVSLPTSVVVIGYVVLFGGTWGVGGLVYATVIGLSLQAVLLLPGVVKLGIGFRPSLSFANPHVREAMRLSLPVLLSVASFQISTLFNTTLATRFYVVAIMMFVQNLMLVAILSIIYALMGVYLPKLTTLWEQADRQGYRDTLTDVLLIVLSFLIPASVGLFMLAEPIINLISGWGNFGAYDVRVAAGMLSFYATGVVAIGLKEVLDRGFYAQKDSKTPGVVGVVIMLTNIGLSLLIVGEAYHYTMPIGFAVSTTLGTLVLFAIMQRRVPVLSKRLVFNLAKFGVAVAVMAVAVYVSRGMATDVYVLGSEIISRGLELAVPVVAGFASYALMLVLLRVEGVSNLLGVFRRGQ